MDPLRSDIEQALSRGLDGQVFERCAFALLRPTFPSLAPIPGGHDFGLDGVAVAADETTIGLVCTTAEDGARNLRTSLKRHAESGGKTRKVVFATTRAVSARKMRTLEASAAALGFHLLQVFERTAFAELLYHDPDWLQSLLGLTGQPS